MVLRTDTESSFPWSYYTVRLYRELKNFYVNTKSDFIDFTIKVKLFGGWIYGHMSARHLLEINVDF